MSKKGIRIVVSVLISLIVIAAVYTSVLGAPSSAANVGNHVVSGSRVNLDHYRLAVADQSSSEALDTLSTHKEGGHGCGSDLGSSSDD